EPDKVAGLDAGADDYITKPFSTQELLARIRAVLRRRAPEKAAESVALAGLVLDAATHRVTWKERALKLGPTEFKLLHYLMKHPERVHSRQQLLDKVWGDHVFIEERTVDVHVKRLREALGPAGALVETVRGAGYRITAQPAVRAAGAADDDGAGGPLRVLPGRRRLAGLVGRPGTGPRDRPGRRRRGLVPAGRDQRGAGAALAAARRTARCAARRRPVGRGHGPGA